jgi:effector-binding domain-containing protein
MEYSCELYDGPAQPVVSIRTWASDKELPRILSQSFAAVVRFLAEKGEQPAGPAFIAYYKFDMQNLEFEAGFPVADKLEGRGAIRAGEIPGGKQASCLYVGPYKAMTPAYVALTAWVKASGYEPTGVAYEMYLNDPQTTPPEKLQTRIIFPLK